MPPRRQTPTRCAAYSPTVSTFLFSLVPRFQNLDRCTQIIIPHRANGLWWERFRDPFFVRNWAVRSIFERLLGVAWARPALSVRGTGFEYPMLKFDMSDHDLQLFWLSKARTHEVCGPGAYSFAFAFAARLGGPCIWVRGAWDAKHINPNGVAEYINPSELIVCNAKDQTQILAVAEEALRAGVAPLVVMVLSKPIGLTEGRRLQLAAREGTSTGLAIIPEKMGSNAAETRWRCTPVFDPKDSTLQRWEIIKNKTGTLGVWHVRWDTASRRLVMVPPAGE